MRVIYIVRDISLEVEFCGREKNMVAKYVAPDATEKRRGREKEKKKINAKLTVC